MIPFVKRLGWLVLLVIAAQNAQAAWNRDEIQSVASQDLFVDLGAQYPEGIMMQKIAGKKGTSYLLSLQINGKIYRKVAIPRGVFLERYEEFRSIYLSSKKREPATTYCGRPVQISKRSNRDPALTRGLCLDHMTTGEIASLARWYRTMVRIGQDRIR